MNILRTIKYKSLGSYEFHLACDIAEAQFALHDMRREYRHACAQRAIRQEQAERRARSALYNRMVAI